MEQSTSISNKRLKNIYCCMKQRCYNPNHSAARWYSNRGITVCEEWLDSYEAFEIWALENGYSDILTIDRIDPDGNYCPKNCQWITMEENRKKIRRGQKVGVSLKRSEIETTQPIIETIQPTITAIPTNSVLPRHTRMVMKFIQRIPKNHEQAFDVLLASAFLDGIEAGRRIAASGGASQP